MIRSSILLAATFLIAQSSIAQRLDVFGGFNLSGMKHTIDGDRQDGTGRFKYHLGLSVFVPFNAKDYKDGDEASGFYPSIQYVRRGVSKSTIINNSAADIDLSYAQFNLPYSFLAGWYAIGIGPYAAYCLSGKKDFRVGTTGKEKIDFKNEFKRLDYGASINMQLGLFNIRYDLGLANLTRVAGQSVKSRNFSVSLVIPIVE
jgi:hypothetical protein